MLLMQCVTGGSRPGETSAGSRWKPFSDNNGVSGHAFIGGLVFIDAAKMTDNPWLKTGFYACSFYPPGRASMTMRHYTSQALLGWWMAYCAATCGRYDAAKSVGLARGAVAAEDAAGMALLYQY